MGRVPLQWRVGGGRTLPAAGIGEHDGWDDAAGAESLEGAIMMLCSHVVGEALAGEPVGQHGGSSRESLKDADIEGVGACGEVDAHAERGVAELAKERDGKG